MAPITKASLAGKKKVIVTVPSLDTPVCQMETRKFNEQAAALGDNVVVVIASADLPFADGPLQGVTTRAVFVVDENDKVTYTEFVPEIAQEPNYDAALAAPKG